MRQLIPFAQKVGAFTNIVFVWINHILINASLLLILMASALMSSDYKGKVGEDAGSSAQLRSRFLRLPEYHSNRPQWLGINDGYRKYESQSIASENGNGVLLVKTETIKTREPYSHAGRFRVYPPTSGVTR